MRRIIPRKIALEKAGISATTAWRLEQKKQFPARIQITPGGKVGYYDDQLETWINDRPLATATGRRGMTTPAESA